MPLLHLLHCQDPLFQVLGSSNAIPTPSACNTLSISLIITLVDFPPRFLIIFSLVLFKSSARTLHLDEDFPQLLHSAKEEFNYYCLVD